MAIRYRRPWASFLNVLRDAPEDHPAFGRSVLVRILVTGDDSHTRDRVIRATNRQTSVPAASLRATEGIQRDIEAFFHGRGWYYDCGRIFTETVGSHLSESSVSRCSLRP